MKLRVRDNERLVRDSENFAILNTDPTTLKLHEQKLAQLRAAKNLNEDINNLKQDVSEIKEMISQLIKSK